MGVIGSGTETAAPAFAQADRRTATSLSVACMTAGRRPGLLAGVLAPFREVASEIVVAVEAPRAADVNAALAGIADVVLSFPAVPPADRPIAWLFRSCAGRWILNVDDDEVPSPALLERLPELTLREDITHAWIARRWLHPSPDTYVVSSPWGTEFQLRLALADDRFLQFSDVFHRPVVCHGPGTYVDAPLWHLDTALNPAANRRRKAAAYERERPGMRIAGVAHNLGLYVPELHPALELAPVPADDRAAIAAALAAPRTAPSEPRAAFVEVHAADVDGHWVGAPFGAGLYEAVLELPSPPPSLLAGTQATVDVRVTNRGTTVWRWGADARPPIRLRYRWLRDGDPVPDRSALLTVLPVDVPPGATELVPVHVVAPTEPGRYRLEVDLVHEGARDFGVAVAADVEVRRRPRIAAIAPPERLPDLAREFALPPDVELVALLRDEADRDAYGDYAAVPGPRTHLLAGTETRGRLATLGAVVRRTLAMARGRSWRRAEYERLLALRDESDGLIVDAPNWEPGAAFGREWAWVAATVLLWRRGGKQTVLQEAALPSGAGRRDRLVRAALRSITNR